MPYHDIRDLPDSVQSVLPTHAQEIYRAAFNNAWDEYAEPAERRDDASREETAHKVAWAAVKTKYIKDGDKWIAKPVSDGTSVATGPPPPLPRQRSQWRTNRPIVHANHVPTPHAEIFVDSPGNADFDAGVTAFIDNENEVAVQRLEAAIAADPIIDEAHYVLGLTLLRLGREEDAVRALRHSVATTHNEVLRDYAINKLAELGVGVRSDAFAV